MENRMLHISCEKSEAVSMPPPDPRDPAVLPIASPDMSLRASRAAQQADRLRYVHDVARSSPRHGLMALCDLFPSDQRADVLMALTAYVGLSEEHGYATMAKILMRYRVEVGA